MKLFILTPQLPYPPQQGTSLRNFNIIKNLASRHEITLLSFGSPEELAAAGPLRTYCRRVEVAPAPVRSSAQRALSTLVSPLPDMALRLTSPILRAHYQSFVRDESFDVIQLEGIEMAEFWRSERAASRLDDRPRRPIVVFDDHNAEYVLQHTAFESDARTPRRWHGAVYSLIQSHKLLTYERDICLRAHRTIAASEADARALRELAPDAPVTVIPNGVDTDHYVPSTEVCSKPLAEVALVYTGKMDFRPNVDAMVWFCGEILPRVRAQVALAHLVIVGQRPTARVCALERPGQVEVTGWVPDTRPYVADAAVCVVPLRMGSGTRLKVLEAMAMGKAIVSTTRGVEGIDVMSGRELLLADTPQEFADAVVSLLREPDRRRALGAAARATAEASYDWRKIVPAFDGVYSECLEARATQQT